MHTTEDCTALGLDNDFNEGSIVPSLKLPRVELHVQILAGLRCHALTIVIPKHATVRATAMQVNVPPILVGRASAHVYIKLELSQSLPIDVGVFVVSQVCMGVDAVPEVLELDLFAVAINAIVSVDGRRVRNVPITRIIKEREREGGLGPSFIERGVGLNLHGGGQRGEGEDHRDGGSQRGGWHFFAFFVIDYKFLSSLL